MRQLKAVFGFCVLILIVGCSAPKFYPPSGEYTFDINVELYCDPGFTVHYTTDGTTPTAFSPKYTEPIPVEGEGTQVAIKAIATNGALKSKVSTAVYFRVPEDSQVAAPNFSLDGGIYNHDITVEIASDTPEAAIYYTLDGSDPTNTSYEYDGPVELTGAGNHIIKAFATKAGRYPSDISAVEYTVNYDPVIQPVIYPPGGIYNYELNVEISCSTDGAIIYYTMDGSTPNCLSAVYASAIPVNGPVTIKAIAVKAQMQDSAVSEATYIIDDEQILNSTTTFEGNDPLNGWAIIPETPSSDPNDPGNSDPRWGISDWLPYSGDFSLRIGKAKSAASDLEVTRTLSSPIYITKITAHVRKKLGSWFGTGHLEINGQQVGGSNDLSEFMDVNQEWTTRVWDINQTVTTITFKYENVGLFDELFIDDITIE